MIVAVTTHSIMTAIVMLVPCCPIVVVKQSFRRELGPRSLN